MDYDLRYVILDSNLIFNIIEMKSDKEEDFFTKLEASILDEGFRNPILVRCGWYPVESFSFASKSWCDQTRSNLPKEMKEDSKKILVSYNSGGSRLWVAQKHKLKIPCLIADFIGRFSDEQLVKKTEKDALRFFKDMPHRLKVGSRGVTVQNLPQVHLEEK